MADMEDYAYDYDYLLKSMYTMDLPSQCRSGGFFCVSLVGVACSGLPFVLHLLSTFSSVDVVGTHRRGKSSVTGKGQ